VNDFQEILRDKSVDALIVATPNHWHAPAAILACRAGKHVYVEKPCCHNAQEGEWLVAAARKHHRHVQMGNQRRSWPVNQEAIDLVRGGAIGRVYHAQAWYTADRGTIGHGEAAPVPAGLDYDLWQGPAPRTPYRTNILPYNWHWFWNWGNGELGNNGVHMLDVCRWGMKVDFPIEVSSIGGRFRYHDDQETPDTNVVTFKFDGDKMIRWEGLSCNRMPAGSAPDVRFLGENGSLDIVGGGYVQYDGAGKQVKKASGSNDDSVHIANFLSAVRSDTPLTAEIEEGYKSTLLCHLGNISYRTGRTIRFDPETRAIAGDKDATAYWSREYREGWEPKV
jgi:predicted dehydrogenase